MPRPAVPSRRSDILAAARRAFSARGFAATRMEDIAKGAGISKAALYLQFPSKEALFQTTTIEVIEAMMPHGTPVTFGDVPAENLLRSLIEAFTARMGESEMAFVPRVIIGEGINFPELARFYYENAVSRGMGVIEAIIRHGMARGEFACAEPAHACRSVIGGILVAAMWKHVFEPVGAIPVDVDTMARAHADTLILGLKRREEVC